MRPSAELDSVMIQGTGAAKAAGQREQLQRLKLSALKKEAKR